LKRCKAQLFSKRPVPLLLKILNIKYCLIILYYSGSLCKSSWINHGQQYLSLLDEKTQHPSEFLTNVIGGSSHTIPQELNLFHLFSLHLYCYFSFCMQPKHIFPLRFLYRKIQQLFFFNLRVSLSTKIKFTHQARCIEIHLSMVFISFVLVVYIFFLSNHDSGSIFCYLSLNQLKNFNVLQRIDFTVSTLCTSLDDDTGL
jgi:hypothetical protein